MTPVPVLEQVLGPLIVSIPAAGLTDSACTSDQRSVRWYVNDLFNTAQIEIAYSDASEVDAGMTVLVRNQTNGELRCARTGDGGTFRVAIPTSVGRGRSFQVLGRRTRRRLVQDLQHRPRALPARAITTWRQAATSFTPVATGGPGRARRPRLRAVPADVLPRGLLLAAPQEGLGLRWQTPDFRQLVSLSQAALDPADPANYARYYMLAARSGRFDGTLSAPRPGVAGGDHGGDDEVTTASGLAPRARRRGAAVPAAERRHVDADYAD